MELEKEREGYFPCEKLKVYEFAQEFDQLHAALPKRGNADLRDQISRASLSIVANIAEGAGRFAPLDKNRFYEIAHASANECGGHLGSALGRNMITEDQYVMLRLRLLRIARMVGGLCKRMKERG